MLSKNVLFIIIFEGLIMLNENVSAKKPIKENILQNAPWRIKLLMLKHIKPDSLTAASTRVSMKVYLESNPTTTAVLPNRRRGSKLSNLQTSVENNQAEADTVKPGSEDEDASLRVKLFRSMYEHIRDSDVKVKRAEIIRKHYLKVPSFEIGFLIGEVQEKFDVMVDFRTALRKFYNSWPAIEHINAYEQIANYAVEINHLVDLIKAIDNNSTKRSL